MTGNEIANKIKGFKKFHNKIIQKQLQMSITKNTKKRVYTYVSPEERQNIINDLKLI